MYFQPFNLVHPILHELLHGEPFVLPDPSPTPDSSLQTEIHPDYPPVPDFPPFHDPLLDVRLNPHQSAQHPAPTTLCMNPPINDYCYSTRPCGLRSVSPCCLCCAYANASFFGWSSAGYTEGQSKIIRV